MQLRPYQQQMITDARHALAQHNRILLVGPTGCGKTVLALRMIKGALDRGKRVWFLCHRRELVNQSSRSFWESHVEHGLIMAGRAMSSLPASVGVINTLVRRMDRLQPPDLIIIDEAHRSLSPMYAEVMAEYPDAAVVGLTATPQRTDGRGLGEWYDAIVEGPTVRQLIDAGYLAEYEWIAPAESLSLEGVTVRGGDYVEGEIEKVVDKPKIIGDAIQAYRKHANGKRCKVFCASIKHSIHVCDEYNAAGIPSVQIDGGHTDKEREEKLRQFRSGETLVLCSVNLAIEGLDIPAIEAVQMLRPTQSLIVFLQAVGRGLRIEPGKDRCVVLDQVSNWTRHGLPDDERQWTLEGKKKRKRKDGEDPDIQVQQCGDCYHVFRSGPAECPNCGADVRKGRGDIEQQDGELVKIDPKQHRRQQKIEQGKARTLEELVQLGQKRGMNKPAQWAAFTFASREGRKPTAAEFSRAKRAMTPEHLEGII